MSFRGNSWQGLLDGLHLGGDKIWGVTGVKGGLPDVSSWQLGEDEVF